MRWNNTLNAAVAAVLLAPAAAMAQVDTSEWKCEYCPFEDGYRAEYEAGANYVTEDAVRFGNGTGQDEKGGEIELGGDGSYANDATRVTWHAEDLGIDSRVLEFSAGRPGSFGIDLNYREMPYRRFGSTATVFSSSDSGTLTLPSTWVTAGTTAGLTDLNSSLRQQNIEKDRQILEFGGNYLATSRFKLFADYRRQQRDGVSIASGAGFTQGSYLPRPVDDYTDEMELGGRYAAGNFNIAFAYFGSFYRNDIDSLTWDNPFTAFPGAEQGRTAVEPDNDFQQFSISGTYHADAFDTVIAFSLATGRGEQDATLLPYTINPNLVTSPLPTQSLNGEVDTGNYAFTLTSRPHERLRVKIAYRYDERDNTTPVETWSPVITDSFLSGASEANTPYSFERARLNVSGIFELFDTVDIAAGYDRTELDRDFQEVAEQTEDAGWGKLRWRPNGGFEATIKGGASTRDIDDYDTNVAASLGQNPLMRKYNLAYRHREFAEVSLSASSSTRPLSASITYLYADDSYSESELGLTESEEGRFTVDLNWAVSDTASIYVLAGSESIDATQIGSETFAGPVWEASHDDDFTHYGGGFRVAGMSDKLDLQLDFTRSEGETEILYSGQAVSAIPLPELESTLDALRLSLRYKVSERFDVNADARYESFEAEDWALEGVAPDTIPTVLTMGADPYDYDVWVFGISFTYKIGAD